jgi:uncharacterized membrane protein YeaQ/YmgE (transglycosylase-associated protein family)
MPVPASRIRDDCGKRKAGVAQTPAISTGDIGFSTGGLCPSMHGYRHRSPPDWSRVWRWAFRPRNNRDHRAMFSLIGTILVGLIVGAIAKLLSPGRDPGGWIVTILIGIAGAFIAKFLGQSLFGWYREGDAPGWIMSILGAVLLLWLYKLATRNRSA